MLTTEEHNWSESILRRSRILREQILVRGGNTVLIYEQDSERNILRSLPRLGDEERFPDMLHEHYQHNLIGKCLLEATPLTGFFGDISMSLPISSETNTHTPLLLLPLVHNRVVVGICGVLHNCTKEGLPTLLNAVSPLCEDLSEAFANENMKRTAQRFAEAMDIIGKASRKMQRLSSKPDLTALIVDIVVEGLKVRSCGLFLRSDEDESVWSLAAHRGYPPHAVTGSNYTRGQGLTGTVLLLPLGRSVLSDDMELEPKFSRRFGQTVWRDDDNATGPVAFLGVPLFSNQEELPSGALVCIRTRRSATDRRYFHKSDQEILVTIASHASVALDTLEWRRRFRSRLESQLEVSRPTPEGVDIYSGVLEALQREFRFQSLLLTVVNSNRTRILGVACLGFPDELKADTNRPLLTISPATKSEEDILSVVCREGINSPIVIHPQNSEDRFAPHLNASSMDKFGLWQHTILITPLCNRAGCVMGAIVHTHADRDKQFTKDDLDHFSLFANHLASIIELRESELKATHERRLYEELLTAIQNNTPEQMAPLLFAWLEEVYGYNRAALYVYHERKDYLYCDVTHNWNDIRGKRIDLPSDPQRTDSPIPFIESVFRQGARFYDHNNIELNACSLVLPPSQCRAKLSCVGFPLAVLGIPRGVMVVASDNPKHPIGPLDIQLLAFHASLCTLSLSILKTNERLAAHARTQEALADIALDFGKISTDPNVLSSGNIGQIAASARSRLTSIVTRATELLESTLGALYLSDEPVCVSSGDSEELDTAYLNNTRKFILRAGSSLYPEALINNLVRIPNQKGLTALILHTRKPQFTPDVQNDANWSGSMADIMGLLYQERQPLSGGLRTWLGVPIIFDQGERKYLFGAITFTRERDNVHDHLAFGKSDIDLASEVAIWLALAFQGLSVAGIEFATRAMRESRRQFEYAIAHQTNTPLKTANACIQLLHLEGDRMQKDEIRDTVRAAMRSIQDAKLTMDRLLRGARANSKVASSDKTDVGLAGVVDNILKSHKATAITKGLIVNRDKSEDAVVRANYDEVTEAVRNVVDNAFTYTQIGGTITVRINDDGAHGILEIADNGPGIEVPVDKKLFDPFFQGENVTRQSQESHGLGLYLAKSLIFANGGELYKKELSTPGTCFVFRLPRSAVAG